MVAAGEAIRRVGVLFSGCSWCGHGVAMVWQLPWRDWQPVPGRQLSPADQPRSSDVVLSSLPWGLPRTNHRGHFERRFRQHPWMRWTRAGGAPPTHTLPMTGHLGWPAVRCTAVPRQHCTTQSSPPRRSRPVTPPITNAAPSGSRYPVGPYSVGKPSLAPLLAVSFVVFWSPARDRRLQARAGIRTHAERNAVSSSSVSSIRVYIVCISALAVLCEVGESGTRAHTMGAGR